MRVSSQMGVVFIAVIGLGCVLAPPVHIGLQILLGKVFGISYFLTVPFDRVLSRVLLVLAFLFLIGMRRKWQIRDSIRSSLMRSAGWQGQLLRGFFLGITSMGALLGLATLCGAVALHAFEHSPGAIALRCFKALMTALAVGTIEEIFFRGFVFQSLRREMKLLSALLISSVFYAVLHYFKAPDHVALDRLAWGAGFQTLAHFTAPFRDLSTVIPGVIGLTLVGAVLVLAYLRTGSLYLSIGLHAGWVFFIKFHGTFSSHMRDSSRWWFGDERMVGGIVTWGVLLAIAALVHRMEGPGKQA